MNFQVRNRSGRNFENLRFVWVLLWFCKLQGGFFNSSPLNLAKSQSLYKIPYSNFFSPILLLGLGLSQIQGGEVKKTTLYMIYLAKQFIKNSVRLPCDLGWPEGEVKVTRKKNKIVFLPLMALGYESPKEFLFGVLEDLSQDLGFWSIICVISHVTLQKLLTHYKRYLQKHCQPSNLCPQCSTVNS